MVTGLWGLVATILYDSIPWYIWLLAYSFSWWVKNLHRLAADKNVSIIYVVFKNSFKSHWRAYIFLSFKELWTSSIALSFKSYWDATTLLEESLLIVRVKKLGKGSYPQLALQWRKIVHFMIIILQLTNSFFFWETTIDDAEKSTVSYTVLTYSK